MLFKKKYLKLGGLIKNYDKIYYHTSLFVKNYDQKIPKFFHENFNNFLLSSSINFPITFLIFKLVKNNLYFKIIYLILYVCKFFINYFKIFLY